MRLFTARWPQSPLTPAGGAGKGGPPRLLSPGPAGASVPAERGQLPSCPHLDVQRGFQFIPEYGGSGPPASLPTGWPPITTVSPPQHSAALV